VPTLRRRRPLQAVACLAAAAALGGCASTSASTSSVTAKGRTLTIWISEPPGLSSDPVEQDVIHAEELAYDQQSAEVTSFKLGLREVAKPELSANARTAIEDQSSVAYLGELAPGSSAQTVGITNALDLLQVSPTDTAAYLTQDVAGAPDFNHFLESYSTYGRTFAVVVPNTTEEAHAVVAEMAAKGAKSVYVSSDGSDYGNAIADAVRSAVSSEGLTVSAQETGADAVFYGSDAPAKAAAFFNAAAGTAPSALLFGSSSLDTPAFTGAVTAAAARRLLISTPGFMPSRLPAAAHSFVTTFTTDYGHAPSGEAVFGYEAMSAVLHAIEAAGGAANDRAAVVREFFAIRNRSSVLGTYSLDTDGDTNLDAFVFNRVSGGTLVPVAAAPSGNS